MSDKSQDNLKVPEIVETVKVKPRKSSFLHVRLIFNSEYQLEHSFLLFLLDKLLNILEMSTNKNVENKL
jgi:hypothetical protein